MKVIKFLMYVWSKILWHVFIGAGTKLFRYVLIYVPGKKDDDVVKGVTFTNSEEYVDLIEGVDRGNCYVQDKEKKELKI